MPILLIAIGGAAGAVARYAMDVAIATRLDGAFPWGTFAVNLSGSFALGLLFALVIERELLPAGARGPLMIGFLGAFTTFSTLMLESWRLWEDGAVALALGNLTGSMILGVVALVGGLALGRAMA
jgi:CrcB protein